MLHDAERNMLAIAKFLVLAVFFFVNFLFWSRAVVLFLSLLEHIKYLRVVSTVDVVINPFIATLRPQSNGPSYSNTVIGILAVDG